MAQETLEETTEKSSCGRLAQESAEETTDKSSCGSLAQEFAEETTDKSSCGRLAQESAEETVEDCGGCIKDWKENLQQIFDNADNSSWGQKNGKAGDGKVQKFEIKEGV